ncbi:MAG: hypothetical protein Q8T09_05525 [Candidatus Melainabacteria bacterium]|nr:hypothetical protein [Candidatus Melainabacteria bacterium]
MKGLKFFSTICAAVLIVTLSLRMLVSILLHPLRIGWDPALHLQCAQLIAAGGLPYVDMFDVNPPLIWYIDVLPALLSSAINVPVTLVFNLFMWLLMILSASMCSYVALTKLRQENSVLVNLGLIFGLLYFNFFLTFDFGQREQIFVLLYFPFIFLRFARYQGALIGRREAVLVGLLASIGICLKHYFLFNVVCVELFLFLGAAKHLRWRNFLVTENFAALGFALLYLAHFLLLPQVVKDNYFGFLVPAFASGYQFWDTSLASSLGAPDKRGVFFLLTLAGVLALAFCRRYNLLSCCAAFAFSGVVPYLLQFKGWAYQDIPAFAGAVIVICGGIAALLSSFIELLSRGKNNPRYSSNFSLSSLVLLVLIAGIAIVNADQEYEQVKAEPNFPLSTIGYSGDSPYSDIDSPFAAIILAQAKPHDAVIFIGNAVAPGFPPTTQLRVKPGSRHLHCCILSVLAYIKDVRELTPENIRLLSFKDRIVNEYAEDIKKNRPVLIFIQNGPAAEYLAPYNFDQYLKNYKKIDDVAGFTVYKLQV